MRIPFIALCTLWLGPPPAGAEPAALEEVLVSARSLEDTIALELANYGHDVELVTAERIAARGYVDVSAALQQEVPGLFVSAGGGPFDYVDVSLQGSRTGDVVWLVDGVRINNRIFNETSPDTLPASMVERIEVLKGGESLFYGTQGVAGAINIVTRSFTDEPGGSVQLGFDSNDGSHASGYVRGAIGEHRFVAYGSRDQSDGFRQYDEYQPSATDRKRSYEIDNFGLKYGFDVGPQLRFDALYHNTDAVLDNNSAARTRRSYNDRDEEVVNARLTYEASQLLQLTVKAYLHDWDTTYADIQNDPHTGEEIVVYPPGTYWGYRDYGASALARLTPGGAAEYRIGYDYQNYEARDDVFPIAGETETVHALFAHVRSAPGALENLTLAAGARYNRGSRGRNATVWNASGRYEISPGLYVEGMLATGFLLPSAEQLYYLGSSPDDYVGNPDLQPEESRNLNVSLGGQAAFAGKAMRWRITAFARDIDRLIDVGFDHPLYPDGRYENIAGKVTVRGGEASASAVITAALALDASYTYTRSRNAGSDLQRPRTPLRFAKAALRYAPGDGRFETNFTMNRVGDVYQTVSGFGRRNFGGYTTIGLSSQLHVDRARRHRMGLHLQNVFNEHYATRLARVSSDDGSGPILVRRMGAPRTIAADYRYGF